MLGLIQSAGSSRKELGALSLYKARAWYFSRPLSTPFLFRTSGDSHSQAGSTNISHQLVEPTNLTRPSLLLKMHNKCSYFCWYCHLDFYFDRSQSAQHYNMLLKLFWWNTSVCNSVYKISLHRKSNLTVPFCFCDRNGYRLHHGVHRRRSCTETHTQLETQLVPHLKCGCEVSLFAKS